MNLSGVGDTVRINADDSFDHNCDSKSNADHSGNLFHDPDQHHHYYDHDNSDIYSDHDAGIEFHDHDNGDSASSDNCHQYDHGHFRLQSNDDRDL